MRGCSPGTYGERSWTRALQNWLMVMGRLSEHRVRIGGRLGHGLDDIPMLDDLAIRHAKKIDGGKAPRAGLDYRMIMDRDMRLVTHDAFDLDLQVRIGREDRPERCQRRGAAVRRHGIMLHIILGYPVQIGFAPVLLEEEELAEPLDDLLGGIGARCLC